MVLFFVHALISFCSINLQITAHFRTNYLCKIYCNKPGGKQQLIFCHGNLCLRDNQEKNVIVVEAMTLELAIKSIEI